MKISIKKAITLFLVVAVGLFAVKLIINKKASIQNEEIAFKPTLQISKQKQEEPEQSEFIEYLAQLEAVEAPKITTKISGYIENIFIKENALVKKGDTLVAIETKEFEESLKQISYLIQASQYALNSIEKSIQVERLDMEISTKQDKINQKLFKAGAISQDQLDSSNINAQFKEAKYNSTLNLFKAKQSELQSLQSQYNAKADQKKYYTIVAPLDGVVEEILQDVGELTNPSLTIMKLVGFEQKLSFSFASKDIKKNQKVFIDNQEVGYIEFIYPSTHNFLEMAYVKLTKKLENSFNSNISVQVKIR